MPPSAVPSGLTHIETVRLTFIQAMSRSSPSGFSPQLAGRATKRFSSATRAEIEGAVAVDDLALTDNPADGR